ncbi:DUF6193 family natural product biosynthesis protein [Embleya sp. NPDC059237]|uniref:DUF6193 family natural product biosynthesis protein n=1 Tax=Embleya sp. NPDC059237 TaxID=3346784 RepID=UPI00367D453F
MNSNPSDPAAVRARESAEVVEAQWQRVSRSWASRRLRHEIDRPDGSYPRTVELLEAAGAEPALRQLFPFTSHYNLHFSSCTHFPYVVRVPFVEPLQHGRFRIRERGTGDVFDEVGSAREAVAVLLAHAPADLGPAVAGNASDFGTFEV